MSNNQQSPAPWQPSSAGQERAEQQYAQYAGAQHNSAQQYAGAPAAGPGYGVPPQPARQTGKRIISMVFLVIGYVMGGLFLLVVPSVLSGVFAEAATEGAAAFLGGLVGTFLFPVLFAILVVFMHLWRRRIKQDELRQMKY